MKQRKINCMDSCAVRDSIGSAIKTNSVFEKPKQRNENCEK